MVCVCGGVSVVVVGGASSTHHRYTAVLLYCSRFRYLCLHVKSGNKEGGGYYYEFIILINKIDTLCTRSKSNNNNKKWCCSISFDHLPSLFADRQCKFRVRSFDLTIFYFMCVFSIFVFYLTLSLASSHSRRSDLIRDELLQSSSLFSSQDRSSSPSGLGFTLQPFESITDDSSTLTEIDSESFIESLAFDDGSSYRCSLSEKSVAPTVVNRLVDSLLDETESLSSILSDPEQDSVESKSNTLANFGSDVDSIRRRLAFVFDGICMELNKGWWTYQWCHEREIRQYHKKQDKSNKADLSQNWSLGKFSETKSNDFWMKKIQRHEKLKTVRDRRQKFIQDQNEPKKPNPVHPSKFIPNDSSSSDTTNDSQSRGLELVYYSQFFTRGQPCDELGGEGRQTEVRFHCCGGDPNKPLPPKDSSIYLDAVKEALQFTSVEEASICHYIINMCTISYHIISYHIISISSKL